MKLHLAERDPQHHSLPKSGADKANMKLRILLSYHYYKDTDLDALFAKYFTEPYPDVFVDSGGFSAMTQGVEIDRKAYIAYIKRYAHLISTYANLDVIGDAEATLTNQHELEVAGLSPIPVFHTGSDFAHLERYIEQYPYIALGGMVPYMKTPKAIMPWIIQCFKLAKGKSVFHGFGATSWKIISDLPWYSVDSSSWGQGFRFGVVPVFNERAGGFHKVKLGDRKAWIKIATEVEKMGFDWRDFADRARNDRAKICAISALSYMMAEQYLRKRHGKIEIPNKQGEAGLKLHLATGADGDGKTDSRGGNMSVAALAQSGIVTGIRQVQADTSNGINYGDADKGLKLYGAVTGGGDGQNPAKNMSIASVAEAMEGLKL